MPTRSPPPAAPGPTDTVPAMLTPGEFVVKRDAVRRIGVRRLNQLNQGYQEGGPVKADPPTRYLDPIQGRLLQAGEPAPTPAVPTPPNTPPPPVQAPAQSPAPAQPSPLPEPPPQPVKPGPPADFPAEPVKAEKKGPPADFPAEPIQPQKPAEAKAGPPADFPAEPVKSSATQQPKGDEQPQPAPPEQPPEKPSAKPQAQVDNLGTLGDEGLIKDVLAGPTTTTSKQQPPQPIDTLKAGRDNTVDPVALYSYLLGKFAHSGLAGHVPPDGARWGIKTGSAAEWAAFALAVAKQESDLYAGSTNLRDPGGSYGLFQFSQKGQPQYTNGEDQYDPQHSADAFVRAVEQLVGQKGKIANLGVTFGSILRPNEAGQYIAGAQKVAAGGSGKDLVSSGGGKGRHKGEPTLVPMPPIVGSSPAPQQVQTPQATSGGGTGYGSQASASPGGQGGFGEFPMFGGGGLGAIAAGAVLGSAMRGGGTQAAQRAQAPAEEEDPMVTALMNRGFTRSEAINFAQSSQTITPGKGIGPLQQPAPAPSAQGQLPAPAMTPKMLSAQQLMPSRYTKTPPPAAPSKPGQPKALPPPAPSATLGTGIISQAQRSPQAKQPPTQAPPPSRYTGAPRGSTFGVPNPPGSEALKGLPLAQAAKAHAALLSDDDPRVKKQKDGKIKGEHFVGGDPWHEQLLGGLPYGKQGRQGQILAQAEQAIGEKQPMHISYISAPKEAALHPTRESRTIQYEKHSPEARLMGTTEGQLVGHSLIPVSVGITPSDKAGEPHQGVIHGISTNVLANNFHHINAKLAEMGRPTPYRELGAKFTNDLEGYLSNLNAGHTGTGRGHAVGTAEHPNVPDENHVPYHLTRHEADFINATINNTAAFAKHEDGQALRRLAEANGTLLTPTGETNRMLHEIEQHEPGWSGRGSGKRGRVLEPSIKTFKTGLIHEVHPSEEHMPQSIRPGREYQDLTRAIQRTTERGRPDVPVSVSPRSQPIAAVRRDLAQNAKINEIERHFSEDKITEQEAHERLRAIGEDPREYKFVGGSGGLISPYEDDGEQITAEEHAELKGNLRKKWIGGQLPIEDYRRKVAEVPLPTKPSKPAIQPKESTDEPEISPSSSVSAMRSVAQPSSATPSRAMPRPATSGPGISTTAPSPEPLAPKPKPKPAPKPVQPPAEEPEEAPEEPSQAKPPAPDEPLPTKKPKEPKPAPPEPEAEEKLTKPAGASDKAWMKDPNNEAERQSYLEKRVSASIGRQNDHPSAIPLKVQRNEAGGVQHDPQLNPVWEKTDYDIANLPFLQKKKKGLNQLEGADQHEDTLGEDEHKHLKQVERRRLSAMRKASSVKTMGDKIFESYNAIKDQPDIAAGKGWYSRMRDKMAKALGAGEGGKASEDHELFAQLLGATSAKTPVRDNFIQALDAFEQYKAGKFDRHIAKYKEAYAAMQDGGYKALNQKMREQGILKEGDEEPDTDASAMARWIDHHQIIPKKQNGAKYNSNSEQVLKVLAGKWLDEVGAPKTPNFAGNLTGRTLQATIDVWAARHLHRLGHEFAGEKKGWRPQSAAEPGVNSLDFAFSQDAMKHAADKIGINPDDLQAILWYAEKHHYEKNGWTGGQGAEKGSFDETWDKAFPTEGKAMSSKELQEHYQGEKARDDKLDALRTTLAGKRDRGESEEKIDKYLSRYADEFLGKHGLSREHLEAAPAAPG